MTTRTTTEYRIETSEIRTGYSERPVAVLVYLYETQTEVQDLGGGESITRTRDKVTLLGELSVPPEKS